MTTAYRTSCSYSGGPYQWAATTEPTDDRHVGHGQTEKEAIADLERLLNERAEAAEQDAAQGRLDLRETEPVAILQVANKPKAENVIGANTEVDTQWVEYLIDRHGIVWVLATITKICDEKAAHIAHTWQDAHLAKRWTHTATATSVAAAKAVGL